MSGHEYNIWGIPVRNIGWKYEDGGLLDPADIYPVVDEHANRLYAIAKDNESDVRVIQSYHPTAQPRAAYSFASMVWGKDARKWPQPDTEHRMVSCAGAPVCMACLGEGEIVRVGLAADWRLTPQGDRPELYAQMLENPGDPINEQLTDEHLMARLYEATNEWDDDRLQKELTRRAIALFGPIFDLSELEPRVNEPFGSVYTVY